MDDGIKELCRNKDVDGLINTLYDRINMDYDHDMVHIIRHLGGIDDPRAVDALIDVLTFAPSEFFRWLAADSLGRNSGPRAVEALIAALNDPSERVRSAAEKALKKLS